MDPFFAGPPEIQIPLDRRGHPRDAYRGPCTVQYTRDRGGARVAELVRLKVDVLVIGSVAPAAEAKKATQTIPIVAVAMGTDPVRFGLVASLSRPGANVTGSAWATGGAFVGKWIELLKEAAPRISRVGYLRESSNPTGGAFLVDTQTAATALGLKLQVLTVSEVGRLDTAFAELGRKQGGALLVPGDLLFMAHASLITKLAVEHRLPAIYGLRAFIDAGGLMMREDADHDTINLHRVCAPWRAAGILQLRAASWRAPGSYERLDSRQMTSITIATSN